MKNKLVFIFIMILFVGMVFGETPKVKVKKDSCKLLIKQRMEKLGFQVESVQKLKENKYNVSFKGFTSKTPAVNLKGSFKNFVSQVTIIGDIGAKAGVIGDSGDQTKMIGDTGNKAKMKNKNIILVLNKNDFKMHGFIVIENKLPAGVKVK
jgi:hypothetical protein